MKLGQFVVAAIGDKDCTLTNQLYQVWKSNQQPFTVAGVKYTSIKKHSTSAVAKAVKTRWYTFVDGSSMEVLDSEDYKPRKEIESLCWRSVKTWFEVE